MILRYSKTHISICTVSSCSILRTFVYSCRFYQRNYFVPDTLPFSLFLHLLPPVSCKIDNAALCWRKASGTFKVESHLTLLYFLPLFVSCRCLLHFPCSSLHLTAAEYKSFHSNLNVRPQLQSKLSFLVFIHLILFNVGDATTLPIHHAGERKKRETPWVESNHWSSQSQLLGIFFFFFSE